MCSKYLQIFHTYYRDPRTYFASHLIYCISTWISLILSRMQRTFWINDRLWTKQLFVWVCCWKSDMHTTIWTDERKKIYKIHVAKDNDTLNYTTASTEESEEFFLVYVMQRRVCAPVGPLDLSMFCSFRCHVLFAVMWKLIWFYPILSWLLLLLLWILLQSFSIFAIAVFLERKIDMQLCLHCIQSHKTMKIFQISSFFNVFRLPLNGKRIIFGSEWYFSASWCSHFVSLAISRTNLFVELESFGGSPRCLLCLSANSIKYFKSFVLVEIYPSSLWCQFNSPFLRNRTRKGNI